MGARFRAPLSGLHASPINLVAANLGIAILLKLQNAGNKYHLCVGRPLLAEAV